jgi:hypothetical protein
MTRPSQKLPRAALAIIAAASLYGCSGSAEDGATNDSASTQRHSAEDVGNQFDSQPSHIAVPVFQREFVPPANGSGNFEICLSDDAKENDVKKVTLPSGSIFQSWGQMTGPLRVSSSFDINTVGGDNKAGAGYAVVTTQPVVLSLERPCEVTSVKAVTHEGFQFVHDTIPVELHLSFQAGGLFETQAGDISDEQTKDDALGTAFGGGMINGTPIADVEHVQHLRDAIE